MKKVKLYTFWRNGELECCCPPKNRCKKNHNCEAMEFIYDPYEGVKECMDERSYKRVHGALRQK